eukprot:5503222-Amphidinium_carterae.2
MHSILTGVETATGLCLAIPTSKKAKRVQHDTNGHQLTQLKKFMMENGFEQSIIQVDNEPAIQQLAQQAEHELTIPWRTSSPHVHQGQGAVERFHKTCLHKFVQYALTWWTGTILGHHTMSLSNFFLGLYNMLASQSTDTWYMLIVLADIKHITVNKLAIGSNEQKAEGIWLRKTANSDEHITATKDNNRTVLYTKRLTRMTTNRQWDKTVFENIQIPQMDTTMNKDYTEEEEEEEDIGKAIIDQYFTKARLTQAIWTQTLDQQERGTLNTKPRHNTTSTGLGTTSYIHLHSSYTKSEETHKPLHGLTRKQPPPILAQLDDIAVKKEFAFENNEDKEVRGRHHKVQRKRHRGCNEQGALTTGEVDSRMLTPQQLQQVVNTGWVITERPSNNGTIKGGQVSFLWKAQFINDTDIQTFAATPSSMAMRLLLTIAILKNFTIYTTDVVSAFLNTPIEQEVLVQPPRSTTK